MTKAAGCSERTPYYHISAKPTVVWQCLSASNPCSPAQKYYASDA
ncbi:hypothetical protein I7I51_01150 [Histoplasma capsulatum]|uniref:Uncharacterized protein n=1 Tax=Ajellomyces capsulatus TaxID=5037 RepID=A0A8A1MBY3_AJECA|nr:conserved hypothetical protein [Histoplasma mississippiense (nom. inval.)]EDN10784.1 conserved hypothetical protein [Histoplasma mississippiense (nom. inval.)]QSS64088.1 hypothetical protein I7I51_01150 [Histoplasma capsulatum]